MLDSSNEYLNNSNSLKTFNPNIHKIIKGRMHKGRIMTICIEKGERSKNEKRGISDVEVKNAMFDIEDSKAPGPNGYTARFYKSAWRIIGKDVCKEIQDLFVNGKLLGYEVLIRRFLKDIFKQFGFSTKMIKWIMACVSTTKFSININEEREGYFSGGRGIRQGDPPYLFTLVMEVFSIILGEKIDKAEDFKYHKGCKKLKITHLCFVDDLLVFCHGDVKSISTIKEALEEFNSYSGLKANIRKSTVFFSGMTNAEHAIILDIIPLP
nr:RNA-directed DNA polymerase, eukaryota, reverse transcriptase zinc-binding domain protein [Tanacetum cinerariifolium]